MALQFRHHRLSNGLDIVCESNPDAQSFAAGVFVKTGSRDEPVEINGVSHFLEHMMFKGSQKYGWADVNRIFDELGARYNAFTTQEMTAYYAVVLPEFTEGILEHLSHLLRPALRPEDFDTEKKVILEEIAMYQDEPGQRVYERAMKEHFGRHPLGTSVIGSVQSITDLRREQMLEYFNRRYGPGNLLLSVSGRMDFGHVIELAERFMGQWTRVEGGRQQVDAVFEPRQLDLNDPKLNRRYVMGLTPGPSVQEPARFAARVLADVIGDSEGSRLYWSLVEPAIADEADFGFYPHDGIGSFYLSMTVEPDRCAEAVEIARREIIKTRDDLTDDEIERARNKLASAVVISGESAAGRMQAIGSHWLYTQSYRSLEQDLAGLMSVTRDDLLDLFDRYRLDRWTLVTLGPGKDG